MGKAKKYNYCPFCRDVLLVKKRYTKHVWQCPVCFFTISPDWARGRFEKVVTQIQPDVAEWLK